MITCMIVENGVRKQAGLCLECAEELGIDLKQTMMDQLSAAGIDPNDPESINNAFSGLMEQLSGQSGDGEVSAPEGEENTGIDFDKLFGGMKKPKEED